jgi:hypothetical protein
MRNVWSATTFCPEAPTERFAVIEMLGEDAGTDTTGIGEDGGVTGFSIGVVTVGATTDVASHLSDVGFHVSLGGQLHMSTPLALYDPVGLPSPFAYPVYM